MYLLYDSICQAQGLYTYSFQSFINIHSSGERPTKDKRQKVEEEKIVTIPAFCIRVKNPPYCP